MKKELSGRTVNAYITQCTDLEKNLYTLKKRKEILTYAKKNSNLEANKKQEAKKLPSAVEKEVTKYSYIAIGGTTLVILLSFFTDKIKILRSSSTLSLIILWISFCIIFYYVFLKKKWDKMAAEGEISGDPGKELKEENSAVLISPIDEKIQEIDDLILNTESTISDLYDLDILDSRYRSLVPLSMIDEYMKTERCTALDGTEGAYMVYEEDLSRGHITDDFTVLCRIADGKDLPDTQFEDVLESQDKLLNFIYSADKIAATTSSDGIAKLLNYSKQLIEEGAKMAEELA